MKQADIDARLTGGTTSGGQAGIRRLRQENHELNRANEILKWTANRFGAGRGREKPLWVAPPNEE